MITRRTAMTAAVAVPATGWALPSDPGHYSYSEEMQADFWYWASSPSCTKSAAHRWSSATIAQA